MGPRSAAWLADRSRPPATSRFAAIQAPAQPAARDAARQERQPLSGWQTAPQANTAPTAKRPKVSRYADRMLILLVLVAGLWAGLQNTLAGGGSFITLPALIVAGMSPLAANITSTVALFPGQVTAGLAGRSLVSGIGKLSFRALFVLSLAGGAAGGLLLLNTPPTLFARLVPWLVLFATAVFAWGSFRSKPPDGETHIGSRTAAAAQFLIGIYGGYFGGGIGFLMLAALTLAGLSTRNAGATKNALASVMNAAAVVLFVFSPQVHWLQAAVLGAGAIVGGLAGTWALKRVNERGLRIAIVCVGVALTIGLFVRPI